MDDSESRWCVRVERHIEPWTAFQLNSTIRIQLRVLPSTKRTSSSSIRNVTYSRHDTAEL